MSVKSSAPARVVISLGQVEMLLERGPHDLVSHISKEVKNYVQDTDQRSRSFSVSLQTTHRYLGMSQGDTRLVETLSQITGNLTMIGVKGGVALAGVAATPSHVPDQGIGFPPDVYTFLQAAG